MIKNNNENNWFEEWFNSPYYHILYKNRNDEEAKLFISNILTYLKPKQNDVFVDVACGKGRHSIFIHKLGYTIDGFDLSENSINHAKKHETADLKFYINDIRVPIKTDYYNYAFNLFTSFGYFENDSDNQLSINSITQSLKKNGLLVLDFMNCAKTIHSLKKQEIKSINNINFKISKELIDGYIVKNINFEDKGFEYHFQEKVKALTLNNFKTYFNLANLKIEAIFGDYNLSPFDENNSERLILIAKK
jgi:SAM-dependent methyltransferase